MLLAMIVGWGVLRDPRCLWLCWLYPLRDLLGFCTWAVSFTGNEFFWRGESTVRPGRRITACAAEIN